MMFILERDDINGHYKSWYNNFYDAYSIYNFPENLQIHAWDYFAKINLPEGAQFNYSNYNYDLYFETEEDMINFLFKWS